MGNIRILTACFYCRRVRKKCDNEETCKRCLKKKIYCYRTKKIINIITILREFKKIKQENICLKQKNKKLINYHNNTRPIINNLIKTLISNNDYKQFLPKKN